MKPDIVKKIFDDEGIKTSITCIEAFDISEKHSISKTEIARYCNANNIKIKSCQLGCFK